MKKTSVVYVIFLGIIFNGTSCTYEKQNICLAGTPGNLTLKVYLQHGVHQIVNLKNYRDTLYVKYNARVFPGSDISMYDVTVFGAWGDDYVRIPNLRCGDYFIYAVGYESAHSYRVSGGIPYTTEQKEGEVNLTIPVVE